MKAVLTLFTAALALAQDAGVKQVPRRDLPAQTGNASVAGAVLDAVTHTPIRKATVTLSGRTVLRAVTGEDGQFTFRQLPAGPYTIQVQAEKYPNPGQVSFDSGNQASVSLTGEEQTTDVSLSLTPGASLRGRIVDEEGDPMSQCSITATRLRNTDIGKTFADAGSNQSDDKGEYHLENLAAGKYYVVARCFANIPMPHAFVRRDAMAVVPTLTYPPLFYPASTSLSDATRVTLSPGTDLTGIDFRMAPVAAVGVRGRVQPIVTDANLQVSLRPKDPLLRRFQQQGARLNRQTGEFQIPSVPPGSYDLIAITRGDRMLTARVPIEVGVTAPEPIDLHLVPEAQVTGSIAIDGDANISLKNLQIFLTPMDEPINAPPQAQVQSDGTFTATAPPGRWRLRINGAPGYVKSMTVGDQEVPGNTFEIGSAPVSLKLVIGTKTSQVDAAISGIPASGNPVSALIWSPDTEFQQSVPAPPQAPPSFHLPPGKYYTCALQVAQPFMVLQDRGLKDALAKECSAIEVSEGTHMSVQIPFIPTDDLKRLADSLDADDSQGF